MYFSHYFFNYKVRTHRDWNGDAETRYEANNVKDGRRKAWTKILNAILLSGLLLFSPIGCSSADMLKGLHFDKIKMPSGFKISLYAHAPGARSLALGPDGVIFVGTREQGIVYAVVDKNNDNKADKVIELLKGLNAPNGVAFRNDTLYVAEIGRVSAYKDIEKNLQNPPAPQIINSSFPKDEHHGWKYIAFGPDDMLYVPVGAPCNICAREDKRYASVMRMEPNGEGLEIYAEGVRNTVGFDWHPESKALWFTDNGRDWMGDNKPPDELNRAPQKGMHFGFPYCHGRKISDPEYGHLKSCNSFTSPAKELGPHVAALGMKFYDGKMFPEKYRNQVFIAEHGSWNRTVPIGYRITLVRIEGQRAVEYDVFAEGWLHKERAWGRPVDILVMTDGALLVSDDRAGALYRISYEP